MMTQDHATYLVRSRRLLASAAPATLCGISLLAFAPAAQAAGTVAGTNIQNIASASYDTPDGPVEIQSNTNIVRVDELLNVTVDSTDPGDVVTAPGATSNVQKFRITNTGNGSEGFTLSAITANGGDDFDPALVQIVIDDGDGVYEPGQDIVYTAGVNDPVLAPDESRIIFVITSTPVGAANGNRAEVSLRAIAKTGSGPAGTTFDGAGQGGGDAVVGLTTADARDSGYLVVHSATVNLTKAASIVDPFGGDTAVPGSIITYTLTATVTGTGTLTNLAIADPIPSGTAYEAGTITLQAAGLTDAADADAGNYNGTRVRVVLGDIAAGQTRTVTFKVKIQ